MTKPRTPPGGTPPGHQPDPTLSFDVVAAPGIVQAINNVAEAIRETGGAATPAPPIDLRPLVFAITELSNALDRNTSAIDGHSVALEDNTAAIKENSEALREMTDLLKPKPPIKATRITMTAEIETKETPMPPLQLHPDQKFKATFLFNGPIDEEPTLIIQGGFSAMTQDPKQERPAADDPNKIETICVAHAYCTQPGSVTSPVPGYFTAEALVDNPDTEEKEKIFQKFDNVFEWIPATQAKATSVSLATEIEP